MRMKTIKSGLFVTLLSLSACSEAGMQQINQLGGSLIGQPGIVSSSQASALFKFGESANKGLTKLSEEEEYYLGRGVSASIFAKYSPVRDDRLHQYLTKVLAVLVANSDRPETFGGYYVTVLDTSEVNALSAPGGFVFISRGFLKLINDEDELASVLAHEVSHIVKGHGLEAISDANLTEALTILGKEAANSQAQGIAQELTSTFGDSISDITQTLLTKGYSRSQEFEADEYALHLLVRSGYDAQASKNVLTALGEQTQSGGWYSTHPEAADRIEEVESSLKDFSSTPPRNARDIRLKRFQKAMGRS